MLLVSICALSRQGVVIKVTGFDAFTEQAANGFAFKKCWGQVEWTLSEPQAIDYHRLDALAMGENSAFFFRHGQPSVNARHQAELIDKASHYAEVIECFYLYVGKQLMLNGGRLQAKALNMRLD